LREDWVLAKEGAIAMATKTGHPAVKNPATHDPFPFRFRISHWPEDGEALTIGEIREGLLQQLKERGPNDEDALYELARTCSFMGRHKEALGYLKEILEHTKDNETLAFCLLALGQVTEKLTDFAAAAAYYRTALSIGCKDKRVWYFIHNNLGYCLNQRGDFKEAETYLPEAINIEPTSSNAYQNHDLSLKDKQTFEKNDKLFI